MKSVKQEVFWEEVLMKTEIIFLSHLSIIFASEMK